MPTYDYRCDSCHHDFTAMHKIADPAPACPNCGGPVQKQLSAPAVHGGGGVKAASAPSAAPAHSCGAGCGHRH
ncbi:zinc ribbon domain-containing protein [Methylolobus aquaticus]|nr:zinc ribbon domain-containing protein [Methylolobus aquaticus]